MSINKQIDEFNQEQADILQLSHILWELTNKPDMEKHWKAFNTGLAYGIYTRIIDKYGFKQE
jgi:hypothetical protein